VGVVLVVVGGPSAVAFRWDPFWNPFRPSPDQVIVQAFLRLKDLRSVHMDIALDSLAGKTISLAGDVNLADEQNIKSQGSVDFSEKSGSSFLKADYKVIGHDAYINIVDSNVTFLGVDTKAIKGQWIAFVIPGYTFLQNIKEKAAAPNLYTFKSKLPDETIGGQKIYRYLVTVNTNFLKRAAGDGAAQFFDSVGEINVELSIGSKDYYLYGVAMEKRIDVNNLYPVNNGDASLYMDMNFSKFNETVTVRPPAIFKRLEEVFK